MALLIEPVVTPPQVGRVSMIDVAVIVGADDSALFKIIWEGQFLLYVTTM